MKTKMLLIDGNSLTYRAYYGSAYSSTGLLKTSQGFPVNAIFTVHHMIVNLIDRVKPTHVLIAFDAGKKTRRHEKLATYKAKRSPTPPELIAQFPVVKQMLKIMDIKSSEEPQIEADDLIASATKKYKVDDFVVVSSDQDLLQLVNSNIEVMIPQNGPKEPLIINESNFYDAFQYLPSQVPDIKAIKGDASDNLPGVRGIGEKGAIKLIQSYDNLENVYENLSKESAIVQKKLLESKEMAFLCKELATLEYNAPLNWKIDELIYKRNITTELLDFFTKYELKSLVNKYEPLVDKKKFNQIIL